MAVEMKESEETIAAISTAPGVSAIAVIRLSGEKAPKIAARIFRRHLEGSRQDETALIANHASHGYLFDRESGETIDEVVLTFFQAPDSYTGEHVVEISCHGSPVVTAEVMQLLIKTGARLARPGEFTQRAFLNGKMDLTQAEAVLDVIQAKTSRQGRRALSALTGSLGARIQIVRSDLLQLLTRIVAGLDFPEEIGDAPEPEITAVVRRNLAALAELARTARSGRYLREGLRVAIVGRPNAGKSSLLNQLLKFERAIVTEVPGTTRDSVEEILDLNGIPLLLIDTAGIRPTRDIVEQKGIERARKAIELCELSLFVFDLAEGWGPAEDQIVAELADKPYLLLGNKMDLISACPQAHDAPGANCIARISISAKTGQNIDKLTDAIQAFVFQDEAARELPALNSRQAELCLKSAAALEMVRDSLAAGYPQDCLAADLKASIDALSEVCGERVSEEIIQQVFASFCIGK